MLIRRFHFLSSSVKQKLIMKLLQRNITNQHLVLVPFKSWDRKQNYQEIQIITKYF